MVHMRTKDGVFNFRVAGVLLQDDKVLLHRAKWENSFLLPGGRVEVNEDSETALMREFREEMGLSIEVERLLWIDESFFNQKSVRHHELCLYYLITPSPGQAFPPGDVFYGRELARDGRPFLTFCWTSTAELIHMPLRPEFLKTALNKELPSTIGHVITREK